MQTTDNTHALLSAGEGELIEVAGNRITDHSGQPQPTRL